MIALQLTLISLIISTNAVSIGTVSENNVTKREANVGDLFPDWVPFKNKHGEELGEFVQVTKKPKKRLAPPVNFILRAVAEPEGDDYYDKGQGESDSEDYYEKKEWSDTNRPPQASDSPKTENHTEISEIDGVVNIITKLRPVNPIVEALKAKNRQESNENIEDKGERKPLENDKEEKTAAGKKRHDMDNKYEDDIEYEESNAEKKPEIIDEDQSENEAKKAIILDSVDELKARHAKEQVAISEKAKEEEIYKEEREREKIQARLSIDDSDKYSDGKPKTKKSFMDYEEYENKDASLEEKYNISPERTTKTTAPTTRQPKRTSKRKGKKDKTEESGKLSVFKNPQLYIVYDEIETTTTRPRVRPPLPSRVREDKFSAKYTSTPSILDDAERISLVPEEEGKEGEPTLFFPKKRKGNKKRKSKLTTETESGDTTNGDKKPKYTVPVTDTTGSDTIVVDTTAETGPSADASLATEGVTDAVPASSDQKEAKKDEDYHREKGGGKEHYSEHEESHSEEGKKAYEGVHKETKSAKGHHDKENHLGKYDDHGGVEKNHEQESGHYGAHHHEEHGKKHAKYEESGKHSKGHSTKGSHDIHKKEEYEKNVEFFEEEGDSGEEEKHGGYNEEHGHSKGGHFKNGNYKAGHEDHAKGESGHFEKGGHLHLSKGHKAAAGHDSHGKHGGGHHKKESKDSGKKWIYHHGYPPKTANLVLIDRRLDQLYHGPQYYG